MGAQRSLALLGIGIAAGAGGAYAGHEAFARADAYAVQQECANIREYTPAPDQCAGVDTSPTAMQVNEIGQNVYGIVGGVLVLGGSLALLGASVEALDRR